MTAAGAREEPKIDGRQGSKRVANVRNRLRSTMRNRLPHTPESRMNRAIPWPSFSIVVTPEAAVTPEVAGSSPSLPCLDVPVSRQCHLPA
jgi:hypothetical protein